MVIEMHNIYVLAVVGVLVLLYTTVKSLWGGDKYMLAMLIAINIVAGRYVFERVPRVLKDQVREQLELMGMPELAE